MAINWDNVWKQNTGESRPAQRSATREGGAAVTGAIDWDAARARVQAEKKQNRMQEVKAASERRREAEAEQQRQKQARIDAGRQANKMKTLPQLMEGYAPEEAAALYQRQSWHPAGGSLVLSDEEKRALGMVNENGFVYGGVQPESLGMSRDEFAQLVGPKAQEPQPNAVRDEKKVGRWERNMNSTNYPAGMFAAGMMSQPASILAGAKTALGDAVTGGRVSDDMQKLEQYFAENPDVLRRWMAGENGAAWLIAQETGIDEAAMSAYKTAYFNDWMRGAVEDNFGAGVNDKFKNTVGNWAYTIGAQVPGLIYSGFAAPGGGESGGIVGAVIDAARNKAGVVDAAGKATVDALKGNVATWLIGAGSTGGKIAELARTRGYDPKQYLTALGNGFAEYFTEGLFGISDAASIQKIWDGADGTAQSVARAIGQWLMSGAEEGLEEFVNVPMSRFADRITDKSVPLVGDGGLFDIREMVRNGVDGAIVGLLMGSVGAVTAIDSSIGSAKNARMAAEQLNRVIEFVPERVRPDPMDVSKATPESVQSKETEVLQALETVANEAMAQTEAENPQGAENDGRLTLPTLEDTPQPTAERGAEANTEPVERRAVAEQTKADPAQAETEAAAPTADADEMLEQRADYQALEQAARRGELAGEEEYNRRLAAIVRSDPALEQAYTAQYGADYLQWMETPTADAENNGRLTLPSAERGAEANTAPVEPMSVQQARDVLSEFEGTVQLTESQQRMVNAARETVQEWENGIGQPVGQTERTEQNDGTEQTAAAAEAGADPAVRGQERESAENDALADRAVAGGGQPRAAGQSQSKTAARRSLKAEQLRLKPVSTKSLGLENGTDRARVTVYPREAWDAELTQAAKALEDKGYEVQFVLGALEFAKPAMLTDGCVVGDKVIVRANSMRHTATELCEHERFHTLMNENPGASAMIWEKVDAELRDSRYDRLVEQYVQAYLEAYEGDEARIQEELMADAYAGLNRFGEMPEVQRMVRELAQQFESGEAADLLQGQVEPGVRSSQTAREQNRTRDGTAQSGAARFSVSNALERDLNKVLDGTFNAKSGEVYIGETSNFLTDVIGADALHVTMPAAKAYSAMVTEQQARADGRYREDLNYHGMGADGLIRALEASENPIAAFAAVGDEYGKRASSIVLVTDERGPDGNVVVVETLGTHGQIRGRRIDANKVITSYDRAALASDIAQAAADGRLLHLDEKRSQPLFAGAPASNSRAAIRKVDFNTNIRNFMANVKWENSGQEKYTAESGLEGKTAFMAAYEAARTEKANRQNEPQYSLTQATEGRKMSSRARRDVNQTMNAVQTELRGLIEAETRAARDTQKQVLSELAQTVLDGKNISQEQINDAFETVWNAGRVVDRSAGEAAWDVKEYLRTQGVALSEADQANFADWNAFRRSNFGRLRISKDGTPVDVAYGELNGMRPDLFPADIVNPADQLERMAEVAESLQPKEIGMDSRYSMADKGQMMSHFVDMVQRMEQKLLTQRTPSARPQETQAAADEATEFWDALQDWMVEKAKRDGSDTQETIGGEDYAPEQPTDYAGMVDERNERLRTEAEQREAKMREELKARAMQMKKEGIEPGEILIQTQWYVDSNGEWRHWDDLPTKAAQPDSQGKQLQEAYLQHMTRDGFEGTASLDKLGVKVAGSVANYRIVDQLIENAEAAKAVRRDIRKAERRLNASQKEKAFASSLAAGVMDETDIPASMDRNTVLELADYYILERGVARNDLRTRRNEMYAGVDREVQTLMRDREAYHISSAPVMMWRTPQRSMIRMFGREQGQKIYDYFFAPVAANEAERYRWVNRMYNEVREVEGSDGTKKPLNQKERALTQMLMEGKAVEEMAAQMEERQTVYNAAENLRKGAAMEDVAKEFGLSREMRDTVRNYAEWVNHREEIYSTDGVDVKRIENAAKLYAEKYDQFYAAINDFLVAHGYEPIGFIRGYAPHIQPETQQTLLQKALSGMGLSDGVTTLPASIAGRTSQFRPNKRWNPFFQSRNGDTTVYDVTQGYERYVDYLSDILYHTDDIVRIRRASDYFRRTYAPQEISETLSWAEFMRDASPARKAELLQDEGVLDKTAVLTSEGVTQQFEQYLSDLYGNLKEQGKYSNFVNWLEDYANGLAGKQSVLDRSFEMGVGRTAMNLVNKVTRAFQTANVAGNLSSVLNQSSQLPNIVAENGTRHTAQAIRDAATGRLSRDGWRERSDFLAGKKGIDKLIVSPTEKVVSTMFKPAEVADYMMSCVAVRSAYLKALSEGMSDADAMRYADRKAEQIMGSRMKGSAPQAFRSKNPVVRMLNMFQTEALNSFEHVEQDLIIQGIRDIKAIDDTQGRRAAAKALVATLAKTILAAFLLNRATDELYGGTPAQYDLLGYAANFVASGNGITANQQIVDWLDSTWEACFGERLFDEPEKNDTFDWNGAMEGLAYDVNSDLPLVRNLMGLLGLGDQSLPMPDFSKIGDAVKATSEYGLSAGPAWLAAAGEFVPGGRQLNKTAKGAAVMAKGGSYSEDGKRLRYPVEDSAWNWGRALLFGPSALRETNAYYARGGGSLGGKETTAYQDMVEAGVGRKTAYRTLREVRQLTPEDGSDSVRDIQKWELIAAAGMSESGKLAALSAMMSDSQREKLLTATDYGVTAEQYVAFRRLLSDAESQTQEAVQAAIDQMDGLTTKQKAVLWQLANKAWKAKNNPYSAKIGAEITGE